MVEVVPYSQMDPRWKDKHLGADDTSTIGGYGCLLTCMTMIADGYGFHETPDTVNDKMLAVGGFQGPLIIPALFPNAFPGMIYRNFIQCRDQPAPLAEIDAFLAAGKPVIVEVDYAPNPGLQNHWIVLYARRGQDYLIRDPYPFPVQNQEVTLLTSRYKFAGSPSQIIQSVVFLENSSTPAPKPAANLDTGVRASFPVYAAADGLALRSQPVVADYTLIKRVGLGAKLTVLESDQAARAKIGILNQWLAVLDPSDGCQAYTAAWYVTPEPASQPPAAAQSSIAPQVPAAVSQAKPANLVVKTIAEGVALRSNPEISDATLLKRLPVNSELLCSDPYDQALPHVGVVYQWLKVQDVSHQAGFVAAWYVTPVNALATLGVKDASTGVSFGMEEGEAAPLIVRAAVEGLALRSLPLITRETLLKRLPIDGELFVIEPRASALPKIGKMGEWLHVRDVLGQEGYVAAWYTLLRPEFILDGDKSLPG